MIYCQLPPVGSLLFAFLTGVTLPMTRHSLDMQDGLHRALSAPRWASRCRLHGAPATPEATAFEYSLTPTLTASPASTDAPSESLNEDIESTQFK